MKALAEFAMKSHFNAYALAAVSAAFPFTFWLSAALVGLVTLRKGQTQGIKLLLAVLIGAIAGISYLGTVVAFMPVLIGCTAIVLLASVLRVTQDWGYTLLSGTGIAIVFSLLAVTFAGDAFNVISEQVLVQLKSVPDTEAYQQLFIDMAENNGLVLVFTSGSVDLAIIVLMLARSWQSGLYNPGGFRKEFHQLRLKPWMVLLLMLVGFIIAQVNVYALEPAIMPLLIAGIALVQSVMAKRDMGGPWIAALYVSMLLVPYMLPLVIVLAAVDSVIDIRSRIPEPS